MRVVGLEEYSASLLLDFLACGERNTGCVTCACGNNHLGGDDFDQVLVDHFISELKKEYKCDVRKDIAVLSRLKEAAETAKIDLSSIPQKTGRSTMKQA